MSLEEKTKVRMDILITGLKYLQQLVDETKKLHNDTISKEKYIEKLEHFNIELGKLIEAYYGVIPK